MNKKGCRDVGSKKDFGRRSRRHGVAGCRGNCPASSANAAATSRDPAAAPGRTPPLVLVARFLAVEWPSLGMGLREVEMALNLRPASDPFRPVLRQRAAVRDPSRLGASAPSRSILWFDRAATNNLLLMRV